MMENKNTNHQPDLSQAKAEYTQIKGSDELKTRVLSELKNHNTNPDAKKKWRKPWMKYVATTAAMFVFTVTVMVNASPAFANTVAGIPGLAGVVNVMTFGHYEYHQNGMDANIDTAKIEGLLDKDLEAQINKELAGYADAIISEFEAEAKAIQKEYPGEEVHFGMDSGYQVLTNTEEYLAIDIYLVNTVGSSSTIHKYYTIDKKTQKLVTFEGLFAENADYATVLEKYVLSEMRRQQETGLYFYWIDEPGEMPDPLITADSLFYINPEGQLVICFDKYAVAPGSSGSPEFIIPEDVIAGIVK
jgi:hypothetical protein